MAMEELHLESGQHILEVGIGTGITLNMYPRDVQVIGIDLSQEMLRVAQKKKKKLNLKNVTLKHMSADRLEFADHSFDRVFAPSVMSVVSDPYKVMNEMIRVCKPGGLISIVSHFAGEDLASQVLDKFFEPITRHYFGFHMTTSRHLYTQQKGVEILSIKKTIKPNFSDVILLKKN